MARYRVLDTCCLQPALKLLVGCLCVYICQMVRCRGGDFVLQLMCHLQVLYARLGTKTKLENLESSLRRVDKLSW